MSHDIVYDRFCLRSPRGYMPFILIGASNIWSWETPRRRPRDWYYTGGRLWMSRGGLWAPAEALPLAVAESMPGNIKLLGRFGGLPRYRNFWGPLMVRDALPVQDFFSTGGSLECRAFDPREEGPECRGSETYWVSCEKDLPVFEAQAMSAHIRGLGVNICVHHRFSGEYNRRRRGSVNDTCDRLARRIRTELQSIAVGNPDVSES